MLKKLFGQYKGFEKYFFKADKAEDMITYIKLKHQFRTMMVFSAFVLMLFLFMLFAYGFVLINSIIVPLLFLVAFRTQAYKTLSIFLFLAMSSIPPRYPHTSLILLTPAAILFTNLSLLMHTQSVALMAIHLSLQAIGFYFYSMDCMVATIRGMSTEELVTSSRNAIMVTFLGGFINLFCMKIFYSQFSSLLRKVNTLKDDLAKANNQLNDQNHKLQNNLEMKDVFIYTFSHELKNSLNGLLGNLYLAVDTAKDPQVLQFLSSAKVCGEVLKNFIHNILDSGKLENGNLEVSAERKDVMNFMQNVWAICGRIIQNKRLQGCLEIAKNVPRFLKLDEQRMIQIILNLTSNAVKFTEKGQVRIHVSWQTISTTSHTHTESLTHGMNQVLNNIQNSMDENRGLEEETAIFGDMQEFSNASGGPSNGGNHHLITEYQKKFIDNKCYQLNLTKSRWDPDENLRSLLPEGSKGILKIQVLDSGCGITTEEQSKLFQKFSQMSSVQGQRKMGTGLGLWICKELVTRLGGEIITRSTVGVGSVFEVAIQTRVPNTPKKPRRRRLSPTRASQCESPLLPDQRGPNMMKVLIADDDSFNIELMKNYLNKFGINYLCAHDGEETVSLFKKHHKEICFVITDNFMPKKTGTEAALDIAEFLEEKKLSKIPILCISGDSKISVGERGITCVIQKPINFDRLKEELMMVYPQLTQ